MHSRNFTDPCSVAQHDGYFVSLAQTITDYAICTLDTGGRLCSWNPGAEKSLGYPAAEVIGGHFPGFDAEGPDPTSDAVLQALMQRATDEHTVETSMWCVCKDRSRFQARVVLSAVVDDTGVVRGFILTIRNLTESITVQQALFESEQRFRILVEGVRDYAIYMLDPEGYITNWNSGAALIKGYNKDEIVGQHFSCFYTAEDQDRGEPQHSLEEAIKNNTFQTEAWRVRKDGTEFWASIVIDPIYDDKHQLLGYAKVTRDITQQKRAQEKIIQQREALHQAQKLEAVGRLTGSVAHDFNNFLAIIRTAAELLESSKDLSAEKRERYTQMILGTSNRAGRLIDQLLSFARRQPMQRQVFSVATRIRDFLPIIETTIGSKRTLRISFPDTLAMVNTDPSQLETAVLNMVINARDATPEGAVITISGRNGNSGEVRSNGKSRDTSFVALSVADTGSGIAPEVLSNIFEPFFTTKGIDKGTGLGLSQVYGFAKQSGGDVTVESTPGRGTCFTLYLPCANPEEQSWDGLLSPLAQSMFEQDS